MTDAQFQQLLAHVQNPSPLNCGAVARDIDPAASVFTSTGPRRRKVAIIGAYPSRAGAPFDDPAWEVWGCNAMYGLCTDGKRRFRADRWWEMHPLTVPPQTEHELELMRAAPVPLYTFEVEPSIAQSVRFPLERLLALPGARDYFSCTFAYQIAFAVAEGFEEIALYGVELTGGREYLLERPCVEYWVGYAQGRGVRVTIGEESALCWYPYHYGYDYDEEKAFGERQEAELDGNKKYIESVEAMARMSSNSQLRLAQSITRLDGEG